MSDFNPHEREARDVGRGMRIAPDKTILIHTSVKLVTLNWDNLEYLCLILIHTSVKLVTAVTSFPVPD